MRAPGHNMFKKLLPNIDERYNTDANTRTRTQKRKHRQSHTYLHLEMDWGRGDPRDDGGQYKPCNRRQYEDEAASMDQTIKLLQATMPRTQIH